MKCFSSEISEKDYYFQVLEQGIDAVVSIDQNNNITYFNPAAEGLWGYPSDQVLGRNVNMLVPQEYRSQHDPALFMKLAHKQGRRAVYPL